MTDIENFDENQAKKKFEKFKKELNSSETSDEKTIKEELLKKAESVEKKEFTVINNNFDQSLMSDDTDIIGTLELPSKGKGYEIPELKMGSIQVSALNGIDEERLLSLRNDNDPTKSFYKIMNSKIKTQNVSVYDLYLNDFAAFLFFLKHISTSDIPEASLYSFVSVCPSCGSQINADADIKDLDFKDLENSIPSKIITGDYEITMKPLTILDDLNISKKVQTDKKNAGFKAQGIDTYRIRMWEARTLSILDLKNNKEIPKNEYFHFYLKMNLSNKQKLRKTLDTLDNWGFPTYITYCQSCKEEVEVSVPLDFLKLFSLI